MSQTPWLLVPWSLAPRPRRRSAYPTAPLGQGVRPPRGFEYFEHTADVGIHAWGATLGEAFAEAAKGLVANMVEVEAAKSLGEVRLELDAENAERLFFRFLEEVLDVFYTRLWVVTDADVTLQGETRLTATLRGEPYDPKRHGHVHEIKAITWHELAVQRSPPDVRIVVDI